MLQALYCKGVEKALSVPEFNGAALSFSLSKMMLAVICYMLPLFCQGVFPPDLFVLFGRFIIQNF